MAPDVHGDIAKHDFNVQVRRFASLVVNLIVLKLLDVTETLNQGRLVF